MNADREKKKELKRVNCLFGFYLYLLSVFIRVHPC